MPKKPWPRDVLIITASSGEFANTTAMAAVVRVRCRDCGRPLLASSFTIAVAAVAPSTFWATTAATPTTTCLAC